MIDLKPASVADAEVIFDSWGRFSSNFARLTAPVFVDLADAKRYLESVLSNPRSVAFHIVRPGGEVVGFVKAIVAGHRAQVGYVVHEPFCGRGFATQAVASVTATLERSPGISRIWATCALDNPASVRVLEKCGFQREATLKNWVVYPALDNRAVDNYSYVKLPSPLAAP
jgi:RimJ/RimL family protein N-acetyltransferase